MAEITASMVKELRQRTGMGMMECKKALAEVDGDMKKAEDLLRIKSGAKASKVAGRVAAEGAIGVHVSADSKLGAMVEVNCETDFVAKDGNFGEFVNNVAELVASSGVTDVDKLLEQKLASGETVEEKRQALVAKLGENITIRRAALHRATGKLANYLHGIRIGVLVDVDGGDDMLGKDLAMHIAASKPVAVSREQVAPEVIERERDIAKARALEEGKPENIVEKIVEGSVRKFLSEITLHGQPFVKDDKVNVEKLLASKNAKVAAFSLFVVGEGIEKKTTDFAAEVAAQTAQAR
ncbi:MAG: elongation factor Ts [Betaproteobacteria bacterium SG8_40]|jgi:elongation factor Ts|nr:MAG: elongation factor Ts [Betaproteobacteria bacterium SG8_40]